MERGVWVDDENPIYRRGLGVCLADAGIAVAGESARLRPEPDAELADVLLFDVDAAGIAAAAALGRSTGIRLIGVARDPTEELLFDSVEAGLAGLLVRAQVTPATLVECVRTVRLGQGSMPPALLARLVDGLAKGGGRRSGLVGGLAKRELDVLRLLAEGGSTREIAATLAYSERTVKNIVHDVLTKMNCRTRAHAVALATQRGVI